jgi:bifunctional DNA-binding transcriptional regulator/antitoxin component of YhaV-PrlF toxin-antitoxin module
MKRARSRMTAQNQVSVPLEVRRRLALAPGATLEWDEEGGRVVVRRAGGARSVDVHAALFPRPPEPHSVHEMDEGIARHMASLRRARH